MVDKTQALIIVRDEIINQVITSTEAVEILNVTDSYIIKLVSIGEFEGWEYRKTSKVLLFNKESILNRVNKFNKRKRE